MCRKYETGFPVHDTDPFSGSILETCIMVPISAMQSEEEGGLFTYVAARRLKRVRVFQLGVQGLEDRGRVDGGGGIGVRRAVPAAAVEILASEVHAVRGALGCQIHL